MSSNIKNSPSNPAAQPFNVFPKRNLYKKRAWWQKGNSNNTKQRD